MNIYSLKKLKDIFFLIVFVLLLLFGTLHFKVYHINGDSMYPTLIEGDFVLLNKKLNTMLFNLYKIKSLEDLCSLKISKNDICIFYHPHSKEKCIKRCMGIKNDTVLIYDEQYDEYYFSQLFLLTKDTSNHGNSIHQMYLPLTKRVIVQENYFYFLGDNTNLSIDSRHFGMIKEQDIIGKANLVLFSYHNGKFHWSRFLKKIG